ncbi:MAG: ribosome biogenesis GTPase YlqF, partial [Oscillospiraceae bacterium]|nr:ribosome biogenesis GTPase YlqF [Oscillospiraceae bacterium]
MNIQWYPGHMTKTRRQIEADLKNVDIVAEIVDARIPAASRNPDIDAICAGKPRLIVLNRADQADPAQNKAWSSFFRQQGFYVMETDAKTGSGVKQFSLTVREALKDQIARWREKGQVGRPVRAMIVGVPNVGKSTFINKVARKKSAKTSDRPGVTRGKQWVNVDSSLDLLDTPGILWPKFEDETTGMLLAFTGAVKDDVMDVETLGCHFMALLGERYP